MATQTIFEPVSLEKPSLQATHVKTASESSSSESAASPGSASLAIFKASPEVTRPLPNEASPIFQGWPNDAGFNAEVEQRSPIMLEVTGTIPSWAAGTLYRTGPGNHKLKDVKGSKTGEFSISHWFDGFSHTYRFEITSSERGFCKVMYNSRRQVDELITGIKETGRYDVVTFGQKRDPCDSIFQKLKSVFTTRAPPGDQPNGINIAVTIHPNMPGFKSFGLPGTENGTKSRFDSLVACTDSWSMKAIDPETLQPLGVVNQNKLHPLLKGPMSAAHPEFDPITGDCFIFNFDFSGTVYRIFQVSRETGDTSIIASIAPKDVPGLRGAYIHSFFMTDDFLVLTVWPAYYSGRGLGVLWHRNFIDALEDFNPNAVTKFLVVDRKGGRGLVATYDGPAGYSFHSITAWQETQEDGSIDVTCETILHSDLGPIKRLYYENILSSAKGIYNYIDKEGYGLAPDLIQYKLSGIPAKGVVAAKAQGNPKVEELLRMKHPHAGELPTMNPKYNMKPHRYTYSLVSRGLSSFFDCIVKCDTKTQTSTLWSTNHHTPGEPIFVARPGATEEDDGCLLSVVLDGDSGTSYLLCLDASNLKELGRAEVPCAVGLGFHGTHVPY